MADDNVLVRYFSELPEAAAVADRIGRKTLADLDSDLRNALAAFMIGHQAAVDLAAETYAYWSSEESSAIAKRRVTLARVLTDPESFGDTTTAAEATRLRTRYAPLLNALVELGCFFLRRGAIENYYSTTASEQGKPERTAEEAAGFEASTPKVLEHNYAHIIAALTHIAPNQRIDEDQLLRPKLGAVLTAAFLGMNRGSSDEQLNMLARTTIGADADVFKLFNRSKQDLRIGVEIASPLFQRNTFPFELGREDNPNVIVPTKLPGTGQE